MNSDRQRLIFGLLAFIISAILVAFILSPWVDPAKNELGSVVMGNVIAWPAIVLAFFFGSSDGSKQKERRLNAASEDNDEAR